MNKLVAVAQVALCLVFVFCNNGGGQTKPSELVGQWVDISEYEDYDDNEDSELIKNIELFKDGTGVVDGRTISWKVENKRFVILSSGSGMSCNYKVSGYELALAYDDGKSAIFVKKGKWEEYKAQKIADAKKMAEKAKESVTRFKDSRDGKVYKIVKVGSQTWFAENLNYAAEGSKCFGEGGVVFDGYDDEGNPIPTKLSNAEVQANCVKYGRLYTWSTAKQACPAGTHLPTSEEWNTLVNYVGGKKTRTAGTKLKSSTDWKNDEDVPAGTDEYAFSALPGGHGSLDGWFYHNGTSGGWWSSTELDAYFASAWATGGSGESFNDVNMIYEATRRDDGSIRMYPLLFSVRCVQD